jgi:hypothetical protein
VNLVVIVLAFALSLAGHTAASSTPPGRVPVTAATPTPGPTSPPVRYDAVGGAPS